MSSSLQKKFTTGLVIHDFVDVTAKMYTSIEEAKRGGEIDEALVIVLPQGMNDISGWNKRIQNAEEAKYLNSEKQYDVWHGEPLSNEIDKEYVERVALELKQRYPHQEQIIIYNSNVHSSE